MIATDLYEGIRPAGSQDVPAVSELLSLLIANGHQPAFDIAELGDRLADVTVIEREGKVRACARFVGRMHGLGLV